MRIDQLLVRRGLASTRSQAQRLIAAGVMWQQGDAWRPVTKNGDDIPEAAPLRLLDDAETRYVSRGGLKLEAALTHLGLPVQGWQCLDVGQSTGGFTDCLLQRGARLVVGVDVGSGQLHPSLRADPRVRCLENINARALSATALVSALEADAAAQAPCPQDAAAPWVPEFDLIVVDLSFISQTLVLPAIVPMLKPQGWLLSLVKPQFELQPGQVGKGGIVRDAALYPVVAQRLRETCEHLGLKVIDWFDSIIPGGDGNREFFIGASKPALP